ncbi:MAG: hypothetical protein KAQ98_05980 [Bacteriovoracaceae bacterium]|nr:hypothetical protein [Bacteriovoracaceae bacterium]
MKLKIESHINGRFKGCNGSTVFELTNGQKWQQAEFKYHYSDRYQPEVKIWEKNDGHYIGVDGENDLVKVRRMQ